ncbi:hypothetical protein RPB_2070 [Rhodopseudomonas palustris HaA2]|uniref:Uncharacterized protein n=1 Tax=Rhodopseudomonas palustris (strain HaA2) TaxID=316058 RepID=Q2IYD4_RHOP2|nr:PIG-L family deacetylase [Rhodopseudomonas palustris]ABD06776.1 hypothetical protein RPB_2070 [Rhodopseudomonas palustris HaA2]
MNAAGRSIEIDRCARDAVALLPHVVPHRDGLQTLGGRVIALPAPARALVARFAEGHEFDDDELSDSERAAARDLIEAGYLLRLPPARPIDRAAPVDVVLSPHIDDAALSLGGTIAQARRRTLVVNAFTSQSYQTGLRVPPERLDAVACAEDRLAGRLLGYDAVSLGLAGAQDRHRLGLSATMGWPPRDVADRFAGEIDAVAQRAVAAIRNALGRAAIGSLYAPAAIGGHLDHVVVALAGPAIAAALGLSPGAVAYYEDLPYAAAGWRGGVELRERAPRFRDISAALERKRAALAIFKTRLRAPQIELCIAHAARIAQRGAVERCYRRSGDEVQAEDGG